MHKTILRILQRVFCTTPQKSKFLSSSSKSVIFKYGLIISIIVSITLTILFVTVFTYINLSKRYDELNLSDFSYRAQKELKWITSNLLDNSLSLSVWTELYDSILQAPTIREKWLDENFGDWLDTVNIDFGLVFDKRGNLVYKKGKVAEFEVGNNYGESLLLNQVLQRKKWTFTFRSQNNLIFAAGSTIQHSEDTRSEGENNGAIILGTIMDKKRIEKLEKELKGKFILIEPIMKGNKTVTEVRKDNRIYETFPVFDYAGKEIFGIKVSPNLSFSQISTGYFLLSFILIVFTASIILLLIFYTQNLLLLPLKTLTNTVKKMRDVEIENISQVSMPLTNRGDEWGELARQFDNLTGGLEKAYQNLKDSQAQLIHSARLAGIGSLAAGVAHEINNPLTGIIANLEVLKEGNLKDLLEVISELKGADSDKERLEGIRQRIESIAAEFLTEIELPIECADNIKGIVAQLLTFSRPVEEKVGEEVDINKEIEQSIAIVWHELKYKCEIVKCFQPLPKIFLHPGRIKQVFTNLLVNAAHSIEKEGKITITTYPEDSYIFIKFTDTGKGISQDIQDKIFEPFFTTKEAGKGTGLGLSISYSIIQNYKGTIDVTSKVGEGTTFTIKLPLN